MIRFAISAATALLMMSAASAGPTKAEIAAMTLDQLKAQYETDAGQTKFADYDAYLRCTRECWNTSTDCTINEGQGCNQYYADCMDRCNQLYRDN